MNSSIEQAESNFGAVMQGKFVKVASDRNGEKR
jgi:hypothetical protein